MMMEAEKSHDLPSANWRIRRPSSSFPPKLSPKPREAEKPWYTSWTKPEYPRPGNIDTEGQKKYRCPSSNRELIRLLSAFFFYLGLQQPECYPPYRWGQCALLHLLTWALRLRKNPSKTHLEIVWPALGASLNPGKLILEKSTIVSSFFLNLVSATLNYIWFLNKEQRSHSPLDDTIRSELTTNTLASSLGNEVKSLSTDSFSLDTLYLNTKM